MGGTFLRDLTWLEAEKVLRSETIVVIPIGAAAKEHGPHLRLDNDERLADGYARLLAESSDVVIAPTLTYHFYPAFVEYPGSTTLRMETARDMTVDVVRSLAAYGPRRFYALNTGVSTLRALEPAARELAASGITLRYTNVLAALAEAEKEIGEQEGGTHADEIETSIMLVLAPDRVDMSKAVKDFVPGKGGLTRDPANTSATYSATGVWGDPTLATREKGRRLIGAFLDHVCGEIEALRMEAISLASPGRP
ncbi:MAG: creatininase family protein [Deltaproteobacteria bacterium]|nr:creatininase family protein [Deltaproteobacteria bacterium]